MNNIKILIKIMEQDIKLKDVLYRYQNKEICTEDVISFLEEEVERSEIVFDRDRPSRCGFPEFIYGASKTASQIESAVRKIKQSGQQVLVTRLNKKKYNKLKKTFPEAVYDSSAEALILKNNKAAEPKGKIVIVTAGTSDIPVAMEAKYTAELCSCNVKTYFDIGVAGIHRLFSSIEKIRKADAVICIAGMEGALPSVLAGLVSCPVIAVPTSVGYGTSLQGFTPLFAMLTSCASGVTVVNINNGFGAACAAIRIINTRAI